MFEKSTFVWFSVNFGYKGNPNVTLLAEPSSLSPGGGQLQAGFSNVQ